MARLNIEDSIFKDFRFFTLAQKMGSPSAALGELVRAWMLAQKWYLVGDRSIPMIEWQKQALCESIIESGLASITESGGVRVAGADEQFAWLLQRSESGRRLSQAKLDQLAEARKKRHPTSLNGSERTLNGTERPQDGSEPPTLTPSLTLTQKELRTKNKNSKTSNEVLAVAAPPPPETAAPPDLRVQKFIGSYIDAFQKRYPDARPDLRGKVQGQVRTLLKDYSLERATQLVQVYLQMNGDRDWFKRKGHDFGTFIENLSVIEIAIAKGAESSGGDGLDWKKFWAEKAATK